MPLMFEPSWWLWLTGAYLAGSIPFGLLIGRMHGVDVRRAGSGNVGATNVGRLLGRKWGVACFVLDLLKGAAPVAIYGWTHGAAAAVRSADPAGDWLAAAQWLGVAAATVVGHVFPIWLGFRGGKGVATGLGAVLGVWPLLTLPAAFAAVVWLAVVRLSAYVSVASIAAAASLPLFTLAGAWWFALPPRPTAVFVGVTAALALLVVWRHRENLSRIRAGREDKVGWASRRHERAT